MHYRCVFDKNAKCMLVGLDWAMPMMCLFLYVTCSCIFHAYIPLYFFFLSLVVMCPVFFFFPFLLLSLSRIDCIMTPKYKSTPAQNPFRGSGSFTSSNPLPLLHVRFHDEKARKDF